MMMNATMNVSQIGWSAMRRPCSSRRRLPIADRFALQFRSRGLPRHAMARLPQFPRRCAVLPCRRPATQATASGRSTRLPVDRTEHDVDRADQGDDVGEHRALGHVGQDAEVDEVWGADAEAVGSGVPSETM